MNKNRTGKIKDNSRKLQHREIISFYEKRFRKYVSAFLRAFFNKENCAAVRNSLLMLFHKPHPKIKQQVFASENSADSGDRIILSL